jgi:hypothetical protein
MRSELSLKRVSDAIEIFKLNVGGIPAIVESVGDPHLTGTVAADGRSSSGREQIGQFHPANARLHPGVLGEYDASRT